MRKMGLLVSAAALVVGGSMAKADFVVSNTRVDLGTSNTYTSDAGSNGQMAGNDLVFLYAKNTTSNGTGSKLISVNLTLSDHTAANNLVIGGYTKAAPIATSTAELLDGSELYKAGSTATNYSIFGTQLNTTTQPKYYTVVTVLGDVTSTTDSDPSKVQLAPGSPTPANSFTTYGYSIHSFNIQYQSTIQGVNATTANGGKGALFAAVVVPHGDDVDYVASFGGEIGNPFSLSGTTFAATPEPGIAGLFSIGLAGLVARRRQA